MKTKDIFQYALGALIVIAILCLVALVFLIDLPPSNKDIALMIIGALVAKFGDVVAYFYNSSKSSSEKTEMLYNSTPLKQE